MSEPLTAVERWNMTLNVVGHLPPEATVQILERLAEEHTPEELRRAFLHRQRQINRAAAAHRVRAAGGRF